jgi:hypothetical protein
MKTIEKPACETQNLADNSTVRLLSLGGGRGAPRAGRQRATETQRVG